MYSEKTKRNIKNYDILRISYQKNILGNKIDKEDDLKINYKESLESAFNRYLTQRNIPTSKEELTFFYQIKDGKHILLESRQPIEKLKLKSGEKIKITNEILFDKKEDRNIANGPMVHKIKNQSQNKIQKNNKRTIILTIVLSLLSVIIFLGGFLCFLLLRKKPENEGNDYSLYKEEKYVTKINYIENVLYRYKSDKNFNMVVEGYNISNNSEQYMLQYIDFFFMLRKKNYEIDNTITTKKAWFTGYISILNMTVNNGTDNMMIFYDKDLNKYINNYNKKNNFRNLNENDNIDLSYTDENDTSCFIKIEFYESGEIRNIYLPDVFTLSNMIFINNIIKLIIPKLSADLYVDDIDYTLDEMNNSTDDFEEDINENRRLDDDAIYNYTNMSEELDYEENIASSSESDIIDLREIKNTNINNDSNSQESKNITNLKQYTSQKLRNDKLELKDSELYTIINSDINEKGILVSVQEIEKAVMNQPNINDDEKNENSLTTDEEDFENEILTNFTFDLYNISMESINNISLIGSYDNTKLINQLYKYFDDFKYVLFNDTNYTENNLRVLNIEKNINNSKDDIEYENYMSKYLNSIKNNRRNLEEQGTYYGLTKFKYSKNFYKYNLLGLKLEGNAVCEIEPSTGIISSHFDANFSFKTIEFKLAKQQTNLHIIIDKMNKMTYNFIKLLIKSNNDLINNNKKYGDIIIDIEKNTSKLFKEYFDYSGIFIESLNDMYNQVCKFAGSFFEELFILINETHENYTNILTEAKNNSYEFLSEIRIITKNAYINYINNMVNHLSEFEKNVLLFLDNIEKETKSIEIFQIDLLYDIIDLIYDGKLIIKDFSKNLFKAIEKGIITFKYDIKDYIEDIIGDFLYITDFLSININKNEILRNSIEESKRNIITKKLKDFRDIILTIIDLIIQNIFEDYDEEMSSLNNNSIKYNTENLVENYLYDIEEKADNVTEQIKSKIKFIHLYENYSNNINILNNINKKIIKEFNNDIYNNIIINISKISPEYIQPDSQILRDKNKLFSIAGEITNDINKEINDINNAAILYSKKYIEQNTYDFNFNIYNFRNYFLNENLIQLINDFNSIIDNEFKRNFIPIIDSNYDLAFEYLNEEMDFVTRIGGDVYLGSEFIIRYQRFIQYFKELTIITYSDEFFGIIEKYFYQIKNDILNQINQKMMTINKYNFNTEVYENNFYFIEQLQNEMYNIFNNIKNYFNEEKFYYYVYSHVLSSSSDIIKKYDEQKEKKLINLYDEINRKIKNKQYPSAADFVQLVVKKKKWYKKGHRRYTVKYESYCKHRNNIDKVIYNLSQIKININNDINNLINSFIQKYDIYLNNLITMSQKLYNDIFNYYENKLNDHSNIINLLNKYELVLNDLLTNDSNEKLFEKMNNKISYIDTQLNKCIDNLDNNIKDIEEIYYKLNYLQDYQDFLEYPTEIIFKINQIKNDIEETSNVITNNFYSSYKIRVLNIIKSTNHFIDNINNFNYKYILANLNISKINEKYYSLKISLINNYFNSYSKKIIETVNNFYENQKLINNKYINENKFHESIFKIINNYSIFINNFEEIIYHNFTYEKCQNSTINITDFYNETDININDQENFTNITNTTECWIEKFKSELDYSKYNFNIVKLRTEIYFTKTLLENIDNLFEDINYNNIISSDRINKYDLILNDKNFIYIYNETKNKLKSIQKETLPLLQDTVEIFLEDFKYKYNIDNEILIFYKNIENILKYTSPNFKNYIYDYQTKVLNNIYLLINYFNETLFEQLSLRNSYTYYNINKQYFLSIYQYYFSLINNCFNKYKEKIKALKNSKSFYYSLKHILNLLQYNKRFLIKNSINNFMKENKYEFEFFNLHYDLGQYLSSNLEKEYNYYKFDLIYNYHEIFNKNTNNYINNIINEISSVENTIQNKLKNIYDEFINIYDKFASNFITYDYINQLETNYSNCLIYSKLQLNETIKEDLIDSNYTEEIINYILQNCSFDSYNFSLVDKYNNSINCLDLFSNQTEVNFEKTKQFLICDENNYFNYTAIIFEKFEDSYKKKLDNLIFEVIKEIDSNYLDEKFLYNYLENNFQIESLKDFDIKEFKMNLEDINDIILHIINIKDNEYKIFLYDILIKSFNISYKDFVYNYILNEVTNNVTIFINNKLESYIDYIKQNIKSEYLYYLFLLNYTEQIGISTKEALINLYSNFQKKVNESIKYSIENEIYFYINSFFRENKHLLTENYINYFYKNLNNYNIDIYKIKNYLEEIIIDQNFNTTLKNYSKVIMNEIIIKIKLEIQKVIDDKIMPLNLVLDSYSTELQNILNEKKIINVNDENSKIYKLILNFNKLVTSQNNKFTFNVGVEPFNLLNDFIIDELKPPLLSIKTLYNTIEQKLLEKIFEITSNFPDLYSVIKERFIENRIENLNEFLNEIHSYLYEYKDILSDDIGEYVNKLAYFTFIDGINSFDYPCHDSFCSVVDTKYMKKRRLNKKENKNFKFKNVNLTTTKKKRNLEEYNSSMGSLSKDDIIPYINELLKTLLSFNKTYLGKDFNDIKESLRKFLLKVNYTCLENLKKSFSMKLYKFQTIITPENMKLLEKNMMKQYYQIEPYIHEKSDYIQNQVNNFTNIVRETSDIYPDLSSFISNKVMIYYELLSDSIQNKYRIIDLSDYRTKVNLNIKYNSTISSTSDYIEFAEFKIFGKSLNDINNCLTKVDEKLYETEDKIVSYFKNIFKGKKKNGDSDSTDSETNEVNKNNTFGNLLNSIKSILKRDFLNFHHTFEIPLPIFPFLILKITPFVYLGTDIDISMITQGTIAISTDIGIRAEIGINVEVGIYVPKSSAPVQMSIACGINGILATGKAGFRLNIYIIIEKYETDLYIILNAFTFQFYVRLTISIKVYRLKYSYSMYLMDYKYSLYTLEKHKIKSHDMKLLNLRSKFLLQDFLKNYSNLQTNKGIN